MKKLLLYLLTVSAAVVLFSSCDRVDPPFRQTSGGGNPNTSDTVFRKILIEDYTGFKCGTCPPAAVILYDQLKPLYGEELVTIGVHASSGNNFTEPSPPASLPPNAPSGSYSTDFRTATGEAWLAFFNVGANPNGMVSRLDYLTSGQVKLPGAWGTAAQSIYHQPAKFKIEITNLYNTSTGALNSDVKVKVLQAVSGTYNLSVVLTEDSIIDWQVWYPPHSPVNVPDYVHRHVLRSAINGNFGDQVFTGSAAVNDSTVNSYSMNLLNMTAVNGSTIVPNIAHCHVVAFVFDATTKEIWQVEEEAVQ
jgi:hypothetical protein